MCIYERKWEVDTTQSCKMDNRRSQHEPGLRDATRTK
jgi:hypothetical protein